MEKAGGGGEQESEEEEGSVMMKLEGVKGVKVDGLRIGVRRSGYG